MNLSEEGIIVAWLGVGSWAEVERAVRVACENPGFSHYRDPEGHIEALKEQARRVIDYVGNIWHSPHPYVANGDRCQFCVEPESAAVHQLAVN